MHLLTFVVLEGKLNKSDPLESNQSTSVPVENGLRFTRSLAVDFAPAKGPSDHVPGPDATRAKAQQEIIAISLDLLEGSFRRIRDEQGEFCGDITTDKYHRSFRHRKSPGFWYMQSCRGGGPTPLDEWVALPHRRYLNDAGPEWVARPPRLERGTYGFEVRRSIQLSYGRIRFLRSNVNDPEKTSGALRAGTLSALKRSGESEGTRTPGHRGHNPVLCQLSYTLHTPKL